MDCLNKCKTERTNCKATWGTPTGKDYCDKFTNCFFKRSNFVSEEIVSVTKDKFVDCFYTVLLDIFSSANYNFAEALLIKKRLKDVFKKIYDDLIKSNTPLTPYEINEYVTNDLIKKIIFSMPRPPRCIENAKENGTWDIIKYFLNKMLNIFIPIFSS